MPKLRLKHLYSARARLIRKADISRDRGAPIEAAKLYTQAATKWRPDFALFMQLGNALKDSGSYVEAEQAYLSALEIRPGDADAYLQRGHLMKLAGDIGTAQKYYMRAKELDPALADPKRELDRIFEQGSTVFSVEKPKTMILRSDMSLAASIVHGRIVNQYRWRRG